MNWFFRPGVMISAWAALTMGILFLVLRPAWEGAPASRAIPRPVPEGDQEIVWLNAATNTIAWERFVTAIHSLQSNSALGLTVVDESNAFPAQTTAVPELAVTLRGSNSRLWFRWYKLTGELGSAEWVKALTRREPPPLAIIGGSSSDRARDLARALADSKTASPPLMLVTTATADEVEVDHRSRDLMTIHEKRSFRFCFTNHQMAKATSDFIWKQNDLRPDAQPVYLAYWKDNSYSKDLFDRFRQVIGEEEFGEQLRQLHLARRVTRRWAMLTGRIVVGGVPPGMELVGLVSEQLRQPVPFRHVEIPFSEGDFSRPNAWESKAAETLLEELNLHPSQRRPLLILPAGPQPARRFLRALVRTAPLEASRFVVTTGDAIDFNVICRDRKLTWHIQDLPFALLLFCHRNPVDPVAFRPDQSDHRPLQRLAGALAAVPGGPFQALPWLFSQPEELHPSLVLDYTDSPSLQASVSGGPTSTSTQDLLLYRDIVETVVEATFQQDGRLLDSADALRQALCDAVGKDGRPRFDLTGNLLSGVGEYIVCLRPIRANNRVLPRADLQVWNRSTDVDGTRRWVQIPIPRATPE